MKARLGLLAFGVLAGGWFLWHYLQFRGCGARSCSPAADAPTIHLASGREVPVLSTHLNDERDLVINYLTSHDREDISSLCDEAKEVWEESQKKLDTRRMRRAVMSPTSPESEFLGMKYLVVPLYTCCISTHLKVEKGPSGIWAFLQCPD